MSKHPTVCVVLERDLKTGLSYLFGVFTTENQARNEYGDEHEDYAVSFDVVRLWS